mmetsp:Transcript_65904/g.102869  ORF Transcript_65904/g.102869 Transcript_65904/m.102869 type:complete len:82 (+) Transcript_65904:55-300(+)
MIFTLVQKPQTGQMMVPLPPPGTAHHLLCALAAVEESSDSKDLLQGTTTCPFASPIFLILPIFVGASWMFPKILRAESAKP